MDDENLPQLLEEVPDEGLGPAMLALNAGQRKFVKAMILTGGQNQRRAALMAGYAPSSASQRGHVLAHDEDVQLALIEEGKKQMTAAAVLGTSILVEFMGSPTLAAKDRMRAIEMVFNRVGLQPVTEQKITVEHKMGTKELRAGIEALARELGMDPTKLLGNEGVIDVEFKELPAPEKTGAEGLEDLL